MRPPAIPNYRLFRLIGEGGFGEVWQAESVTGKFRAVKIVRRSHFESPDVGPDELESIFQREFKGVRRFEDLAAENPALITIHHIGRCESGEFYYYVMPLADDATPEPDYHALNLDRKITRDGPMDWVTALAMVRRLASGLESLHRNDFCHGDVSSANVLFLDGHPVLADPGLTGLDGKTSISHSPGFTDPHAGHVYSQRGDLFALGRVLYHAVTGLHPAESYPILPPERMAQLPVAELAALLDRCCDPDPANRFADADELLAHLKPDVLPMPSAASTRRSFMAYGLVVGMLGFAGVVGWQFMRPVEEGYLVEIVGNRLILRTKSYEIVWERVFEHSLNRAELARLDGSGPVVICSIQDMGIRQPGRLVVLDLNGEVRWKFDAVPEVEGLRGPGQWAMQITGFMTVGLDGKGGGQVVVLARNPQNIHSSAILFLEGDGTLRASYWHPGRIDLNQVVITRPRRDAPPFLAFFGENELVEPSRNPDNHAVMLNGLSFGLLDPTGKGPAHAPMHRLSGNMSPHHPLRWYGAVTPLGNRGLSLYFEHGDGQSGGQLVLSVEMTDRDPAHSRRAVTINIDANGHVVSAYDGSVPVLMADSFDPLPAGLESVDFTKLTPDRMIAHSVRDFAIPHNGGAGWHYGYAEDHGKGYDPDGFRYLTHRDSHGSVRRLAWHNACGTHLSIEAGSTHPNETAVAVRRWTSALTGRIAVIGNFFRVSGTVSGIASIEVHHGRRKLYRTTLGKTRFQAVFHVEEGDTLDFVINAEGKDFADQTDTLICIWRVD